MPAGVINTGSHPKLLWPGIHGIWGQVYNEHPTQYTDLFEIETDTRAYVEDVQVTGFGLASVKAEGAAMAYDSEVQGPVSRYTHLAYGLGYIVTHEELMDNQYEIVATRRAKANAFSINQTIENVGANIYNRAFNSSYVYGDGVQMISTAQPQTTGGTFSNRLSPDADLSEAALEDITVQAMGLQTDRGLFISIKPESLHIARQEWYNAHRILKSILQSDSASNNINVLNATNAFPKGIKMNTYFSAPHAWFVRTNCPQGLQFFWREKPEFSQDNDYDTKNAKASTYLRFSCGITDKRAILGSNGP